MRRRVHLFVFVALVGALLLSACGGSGGDEAPATKAPAEPAGTSEPSVSLGSKSSAGAVSSLEDVEKATVLIFAEGTKYDPLGEMPNASWRGTGFIIDPSGLAVTNNHVATGAGRMTVRVGGETQERVARVLGVSECSDLAVIDVEGDGFPFLDWYDGEVKAGLDVYAAGYPLSRQAIEGEEYNLTKGIISKPRANGESSWSSVDYALEHDATINPGNSGGPLVTEDGKVVGVNYMTGGEGRFFAISAEEAIPVVEQLKKDEDVNSIGVNGEVVLDQDGNPLGVWVASVASGSPADKSGVRPGDIISSLESVYVATDGTMNQYCGVLKSHNPDDTLALEVIRWNTGEVLTGQLNGRELEVTSVFDSSASSNTGSSDTTGSTTTGYVDVADAYSSIAVEIPESWADTDGSEWMDGNDVIGASITAAPDLDAYNRTWDAPGMFFGVSDDLARLGGHVQILDAVRPDYLGDCKLDSRSDYNDGYYRGKADLFNNCGGPGGSQTLVLSAVPTDNSQDFTILLIVQMVNPEDEDIAIHALDTFRVIGTLP
ncbi:MAG: trypsin-like peptidase domain-containing protein [Anaerolineales bacterium]|nr:trypsin-like peptidase domain-containing protein [Anaerolineales bacterium]